MIKSLFSFVRQMLGLLNLSLNWTNIVQIVIVAVLLYFFYRKFIKNTQSEKFIKGLFMLFLTWIFSEILILINLQIFGVFLKTLVSLVALSLIVIFQPELRRFLGYLGQPGFITKTFFPFCSNQQQLEQNIDVVQELIEAVKYLTKTKTGALMVLKKPMSMLVYSEVGTILNAKLSAELILTIFHPNTPLHDGAMIIEADKILSAGVLLPLTDDPKLSWKYGTRHRAAIGMSEVSDVACLVVSEETGDVSICMDGILKKYEDLATLKTDLNSILGIKSKAQEVQNKTIFDKFKR